MTLISITAPISGPIASRQGDLIIPGTEVAFGGFSTLIGRRSTNASTDHDDGDMDVYLLGMTSNGLQLARVGINDISNFNSYNFWDPQESSFVTTPPDPGIINPSQVYLSGTFSSGSVFYSPYFKTFMMVYFNKMVDSTFYIRYLDLDTPLMNDTTWTTRGVNGSGIEAEDVEAIIRYAWSEEQKLYASPPGTCIQRSEKIVQYEADPLQAMEDSTTLALLILNTLTDNTFRRWVPNIIPFDENHFDFSQMSDSF